MPYAPTDDEDELWRRRHLARKREARYREKNAAKRRASCRAANKKFERTEKGIRARQHKLDLKHIREKHAATWRGLHTCELRNIDRPLLTYIDHHGRVHHEEELSAEELIRRYEKERKDGHHGP